MTETTELPAIINATPQQSLARSVFSGIDAFESAQRMATMLVSSSLVPANFQGKQNLANAVIALEMAQRMGASPLAVMQNLYIVHGKPSWSSQFIAASINSCGRFSPVRFRMTGEPDRDERTCVAWATDSSGEVLEVPPVSIAMAKKEGWYNKSGSKWQTMPELMLRYRAVTFFGRLYAPDILMGMRTQEEVVDLQETAPGVYGDPLNGAEEINARLRREAEEQASRASASEESERVVEGTVEQPTDQKPKPKAKPKPNPRQDATLADPPPPATEPANNGDDDVDFDMFGEEM